MSVNPNDKPGARETGRQLSGQRSKPSQLFLFPNILAVPPRPGSSLNRSTVASGNTAAARPIESSIGRRVLVPHPPIPLRENSPKTTTGRRNFHFDPSSSSIKFQHNDVQSLPSSPLVLHSSEQMAGVLHSSEQTVGGPEANLR